uniref:Uncharacterized protein n=1 Tax=Trichobilharzia regenti TaxID=157069 RepID=A0AA85JT89_TRIRE|nr:unnamed protein product [Trichobilharzia regenti]
MDEGRHPESKQTYLSVSFKIHYFIELSEERKRELRHHVHHGLQFLVISINVSSHRSKLFFRLQPWSRDVLTGANLTQTSSISQCQIISCPPLQFFHAVPGLVNTDQYGGLQEDIRNMSKPPKPVFPDDNTQSMLTSTVTKTHYQTSKLRTR